MDKPGKSAKKPLSTIGQPETELQDQWVLIVVAVVWAGVIAHWIIAIAYRKRLPKFIENAHGILVRPENAQVQSKSEFIFEALEVHRVRSFTSFCELKAPPPPNTSFQAGYRTSTRSAVYSSLLRGALPQSFLFAFVIGVFAMSLSWLQKNDLRHAFDTEVWAPESIKGNMHASFEIQKILLPLVSFLLALYINQKLSWFMNIINLAWSVQGKLNNIALELGTTLRPHDSPGHMRIKFVFFRYLNLIHFLLYKAIAVGYESITLDDLSRCGLVVGQEQALLEASASPRNLVMIWLGSMIEQLAEEKQISDRSRVELKRMVIALRGDVDTMVKELTRMAPVSFAQLLQLMIDLLLILTPPAITHKLQTSRDGVSIYIWPAFGSMLTALFYQGGMRLISAMEYPFGLDLDDLRTQWALMSSELAIFSYLTAVPPNPWSAPGATALPIAGSASPPRQESPQPEDAVFDVAPWSAPAAKESVQPEAAVFGAVDSLEPEDAVVEREANKTTPGDDGQFAQVLPSCLP